MKYKKCMRMAFFTYFMSLLVETKCSLFGIDFDGFAENCKMEFPQESTKRASDMEEPLSYYDVTEQNFRDENFALKMHRISKEIVQFNEISSLIQIYIQMTQDARTEASSFT